MTQTDFYIYADEPEGKARILREGLTLFAEHGLTGTSIRDIAKATGLSNPALYKHFATKDDLAALLFERLYRAHLLRLRRGMRAAPDGFSAQFSAFIRGYLENFDAHPAALVFATDHLRVLWPQMPDRMKQRTVISVLRDLLEAGRRDGFVTCDVDLDLQLSLVLGMLSQTTRQLYFRTLSGPALRHAEGTERLLRAGLTPQQD